MARSMKKGIVSNVRNTIQNRLMASRLGPSKYR